MCWPPYFLPFSFKIIYISSTIKTQKNLVLLLFFGRLGRQGSTENFCQSKANSVQKACAKFFAGHILKFEILYDHMKKQNKKHQNTRFIDEKLITKSLMFFA